VGSATLSAGTGVVNTTTLGADPHYLVVTLSGVANAQDIALTLSNVTDALGHFSPAIDVTMGVLLGDSNGDGTVNSGDAQQTRNRSGQTTGATNFRSDYNRDGTINSGDATIVRSRSGQFIP
jgi:hypothetical protein